MSPVPGAALAAQLASRISAIDGIARLFPERAAVGAVLALVGSQDVEHVRVDTSGPVVAVSARLGTVRSTPTRSVIDEVLAAVDDVLAGRAYELALEFASID